MTPMVRAAALTNYMEVAQHLGLNPQQMLRQAGLSQALIENPEQRLPTSAAATLLEDSARASGCLTFGLRMAESRQLSDFGAISLLLSHQPTLRDALETIVQYRHLLNESLALFVDEVGKTVVLREEIITDPPVAVRQGIELAIGVLFRITLPLSVPGLVSVLVYAIVTTWNEFIFALCFATDSSVKTLPIGLAEFSTEFNTDWGAVMAASMVMTLPIAILFLSMQRLFVGGMTAGATKG